MINKNNVNLAFISHRRHDQIVNDINISTEQIVSLNALKSIFDNLSYGSIVAIDTETNGLDPYLNNILLLIFKFEKSISDKVFVIDVCSYFDIGNVIDINSKTYNSEFVDFLNIWKKANKQFDLIYVGHNIKFDYKMIKQNFNVELSYNYCTMLADQRLFKGRNFDPYVGGSYVSTLDLTQIGSDEYTYLFDYEEEIDEKEIKIDDELSLEEKLKKLRKSYSLNGTRARWIKKEFKELDKKIRNSFIGLPVEFYIPTADQVIYAASDVLDLHYLLKCQYQELYKQSTEVDFFDSMLNYTIYNCKNLLYWHLSVEQELNSIIGNCELNGIEFDVENWNNITKYNETKRSKLLNDLNTYLLTNYSIKEFITDKTYIEKIQQLENRLETLQNRIEKQSTEIQTIELKGNTHTKKYQTLLESKSNNLVLVTKTSKELQEVKSMYNSSIKVNWKAGAQVLDVLRTMGLEDEQLPKMKDSKNKNVLKPSIGKIAVIDWLNNNCIEEYKDFILLYQNYKRTDHALNSFGYTWLEYNVHPITNKVHPEFKINSTDTGRLSGGGGKENKKIETDTTKVSSKGYGFNMQQLPREVDNVQSTLKKNKQDYLDFRKSFICATDRLKAVMDWSGAELNCIIGLSGDLKLKSLGSDLHSYFATETWKNIWKKRALEAIDENEKTKLLELSITDKVDKNDSRRQDFKPLSFGVLYNARAAKVAQTLKIPRDEGQIPIDTIANTVPIAFGFLTGNSKKVFQDGFILFNNRSGTKRWFEEVIFELDNLKKTDIKLYQELVNSEINENGINNKLAEYIERVIKKKNFMRAADISSASRNSPIQGTQADAMKEALVYINYKKRILNLDIELEGVVHDEYHYNFPDYYYNKTSNCIANIIPEWTKYVGTLYLNGYTEMGYDTHVSTFWEK